MTANATSNADELCLAIAPTVPSRAGRLSGAVEAPKRLQLVQSKAACQKT